MYGTVIGAEKITRIRIRIQASQSSSDIEPQKLELKVTLHNGVDIDKNGLLYST